MKSIEQLLGQSEDRMKLQMEILGDKDKHLAGRLEALSKQIV